MEVDYGTEISVVATPRDGYEFDHWSDDNTEASRTIRVTSDVTYVAYFKPKTYKVTATPNDVELGSCTGYGTFDYNTNVTLRATAKECARFVKWTDA